MNKKRLLAIIMTVMLIVGVLPLAAHAESPGTFEELTLEILQTPTNGTLTLEKDYQCEDGFSAEGIGIGKTMTIDLNGHTIDGDGKARIFVVKDEVTLTLKGPGTIKGGTAAAGGGGIWVGANAALSLQDVEISGNDATAGHGGGIYAGTNVTLSLKNVKISGNDADIGYGGGIYADANAKLSLENVEIWMNNAAGYGGGIYAGSNVTLSLQNVKISGNDAWEQGGGIYAGANAKLSLQNVEISRNYIEGQGGGVFLHSGAKGLEIGGETIVSGNARKISGGGTAADNVYLHGPQLTVTSPLTGKAKIGLSPDLSSTSPEMLAEFGGMPLGAGFNTNHPGADIGAFFVSDDQSICIFNRDHDRYDMFCSRHTHQMECRPNPENGAELEYVCTAGSCPMPSPFAKLTLVADDRAYNGKKYDDARLDDLEQFNRITNLNLVLSDENGTYLYYQSGEDTGFRYDPLEPGSYWAMFAANGDPSKKIKTKFKITRAPLTIRPETQTCVYNGELQGPGDLIYTGPEAAAAAEASGLADGDRVTSVTIDGQGREVGTYELEITGLRIENSEGIDVTTCYAITYEKGSLVIGKKPLTLGLTMDDWIAGEAASTPVLTGNEGNGDVTYEYKPKGADKKAYSTDVPTAAGEYTVRATVEETRNHLGGEKTADFTIFPALTGISLDSNSAKKDYTEGDTLDVTGLTLEVSKSDGSKETVNVTAAMVTGFDSSKTGKQTLTVTYEGFTDTYEIEVKAKTNPPAPDPVSYSVTNGNGGEWTKVNKNTLGFTFKRSVDDGGTYELFTGIKIDGKSVTEKDASGKANWTAKSGSVIIDLQPSFLETLSVGKHTLIAEFEDGSATAEFTIKAAKKDDEGSGGNSGVSAKTTATAGKATTTAPKTGDENNMLRWLLCLSASAVALWITTRRKMRQK